MASVHLEKPVCSPPHLSEVSPVSPLNDVVVVLLFVMGFSALTPVQDDVQSLLMSPALDIQAVLDSYTHFFIYNVFLYDKPELFLW